MLKKFLNETQIFFDEHKKLLNPNLLSSERNKIIHRLKKIFSKLEEKYKKIKYINEEEKILVAQKLYFASTIMEDEIMPHIKNQIAYKLRQIQLRQKGRTERNHRTHQLIFIGCIWEDFLKNNNLSEKNNVKIFESVLNKISKNVNVAEEYTIIGHDDFDLPVYPYTGRNKNIIHYYCQIGGTWEAFWRSICKNDSRDKRIYKILQQTENGKIKIEKINNDNFSFWCNENHCEKIGAFSNFFKLRCLKLDTKFFYEFLNYHKQDVINALIQ